MDVSVISGHVSGQCQHRSIRYSMAKKEVFTIVILEKKPIIRKCPRQHKFHKVQNGRLKVDKAKEQAFEIRSPVRSSSKAYEGSALT